MKLFRVRVTGEIEPELVVVADGVHHQGVALIMADRVPVPRGIGIVRMLAAIHEDLPEAVNVSFKQEENVSGGLYDPPRIRRDPRYAGGQAIGLGIVLRLARFEDLLRSGCHRNHGPFGHPLRDVADRSAAIPYARKIHRAVSQVRRRAFHALRGSPAPPRGAVAAATSTLPPAGTTPYFGRATVWSAHPEMQQPIRQRR